MMTVGVAARLLGVNPREISDAFYAGLLSDKVCPIVGRVRLIPTSYVDQIAAVLRRRGVQISEPK